MLLEWFDSWRQVLVFEATIGAVATMVWVVVWNRVERPTTTRVEPAAAGSADGSFRYLLGSSEIRLILFVAFALFFLSHGTSNWMPTILEEFSGMSPSTAGAWLAVGGLVSIVAGATIPAFATPERMHLLMAGLFGAAVLVMAGLLLAPTSLHGPIAVIGGVRGALVPLAIVTLLAADRVSVTNTGIANGLWFSIAEIGGVSGRSSPAPWRIPTPATRRHSSRSPQSPHSAVSSPCDHTDTASRPEAPGRSGGDCTQLARSASLRGLPFIP